MENCYSKKIVSEIEDDYKSLKAENFYYEYGKAFYKETIFDKEENHNEQVLYVFPYDGEEQSIFSFINTFAYYLGYTGNIDDDLEHISSFTAFEDYELDNYLLRYRDKNNTSMVIRSDVEVLKLKISMAHGVIDSNAEYYDDIILEASSSLERRRRY